MDQTLTSEEMARRVKSLEALIMHSQLATVQLSKENLITDINPAFSQVFGFERNEVIGKNIDYIVVSSEYREEAKTMTRQTMKGEMIRRITKREKKDGTLIDVEIFGGPLEAEGQILGAFAQYIDITEHEKMKKDLDVKEKRYRDLYENAPNAYFSVGPDAIILRCNERARDLLGYPEEELVGRPVLDLYADKPEGKQKAKQIFIKFRKGLPIIDEEMQMQKADGTTVWVSLTVNANRNAQGEIIESRSMLVDITKRKRAEYALHESEERYKQLVDYANDLIYRTDANGSFIFCNPIALKLMEYSENELMGKSYLGLIREDYRKDAEKCYGIQFVRNIPNTYYEFPAITKTGKEIWLGQNVQMLKEGDDVLGFQAVARDITDRMMAEEALRKASALETLTTVLENFIGDSLGNLLTPIYAQIELCKIKDSIIEIKSSLENIKKGLTKLLMGIRTYRKFFKAGESALGVIESVDVRATLDPLLGGKAMKTYGEEAFPIGPNVKLRYVYDPKQEGTLPLEGLPPVSGSEIAISTALQETLINAVESYDPQKGGEVMVSAKKVGHRLIIEIADKGRGMSRDEMEKSQLPFFKILGMKKSGRLGLGAYIARESAKYCEGDIQIESTKGVGTTASIILSIDD